jgi:diguanylate cyclase (GGDEF)-like protein
VLMLDLDHFKNINDTYGHLAGDVVLKEVANRISRTIRAYDLVGRFGGEEFLVVLPECDKRELEVTSDRIRAAIGNAPIAAASTEITVTTSIGGTVAATGMIEEKEVLGTADSALYRAKDAGRNRTVIM